MWIFFTGYKRLRDNERKIMNFLVNKILDDGSVSYVLTGSGYVVLIIVCVLLMTIGCFARDNNSKLNVKHIAFAAMAIALAVATSMIKVIKLPMGGSVTLFSMLFIVLIGYWYGIKTGLTAALAYGVLQLLLDPGYSLLCIHQNFLIVRYFIQLFTMVRISDLKQW